MDKITRSQCAAELRPRFLPSLLGRHFLRFEQLVYDFMRQACASYTGGYWEFYRLSNGGLYMGLRDCDGPLRIEWGGNYFSGDMSPDAASIGVNLFALSQLSCETAKDRVCELFHALRAYAIEHEERELILGFID